MSASLPMLFARGSYYDVGFEIGSTFRERIQGFFENSDRVQTKLLPFLDYKNGRDIYTKYLADVKYQFPFYIDELEGIADGSEMPFEKIFLYNISSEVYNLHLDVVNGSDTSGCTTVCVNRPNMKVVSHTEDCDPAVADYGYMIEADIHDQKFGDKRESFTAFSYPGALVGMTFGFNSSGMIFCLDGLAPKTNIKAATPRSFLSRSLMAMKNIDEVNDMLKNTGYGSADGFCVNIGSLQNPKTMWNIEVAPGEGSSRIAVFKIEEQQHQYVHSNLYQHLDIENKDGLFSSVARKERANEFPPPEKLSDIKQILGDTTNKKYPIYRLVNEYNANKTVATAIFDLRQKTLEVYVDNCKYNKPLLVLPLT